MKIVATTFFVLLVHAHFAGDLDRLLGQPLSLFRDEKNAWAGYGLFWCLFLVGGIQTLTLMRCRCKPDAVVAGTSTLLLVGVAATDSYGGYHQLFSFLLLALLFGYYAILLYLASNFCLFGHLFVPVVLALATRLHSYGIWQKGFIVYFVLVSTVHHHLLKRQLAVRPKPRKRVKNSFRVRLADRHLTR